MTGPVLRATLARPGARVALALPALGALVAAGLPLFDILGFERAFLAALLGGPTTAALAVASSRAARAIPGATLDDAARAAVALALAPLVLSALVGGAVELARTPCAPREGLAFLGALAGSTVLVGGALGLGAEALAPRRAGPWIVGLFLVHAIGILRRLYVEPQIDVFSPLLGYWPGSLYDEDLSLGGAVLAHRALAVALAAVVFFVVTARALGRPLRALAALGSAGVALGLALGGEALGFERDRATIARALARVVEGEGWVLHVDPGIRAPQLARFVAELDLRTAQLTRFFGRAPSAPIHVWLYANEGQKRALMGASGTQLARPWSREIHIDGFDVPHGVLKHELAHIFAADLADGPLHVPARFGLWPNMVLIEGLAVAADWPARGLTVHQWTRAMRALGLAPDLAESLGPTGFWRAPGPRVYTVAGSFIRHLVDTRGVAPLAAAYASGDLEAAYGAPLSVLLDEWARMIDALPLADEERALAEHRFRAGSIFQRACARSMGSKVREAERALARGALDEGRAAIEAILALDSGRVDLGMSYARALSSAGAEADARAWLAALEARPGITRRARAQLRELDGDLAWRAGALDDARARFRGVLGERFGEDVDRLQQVKLAAIDAIETASTATTAEIARRYLTGELGVDRAAPLLAAVDARAEDDALATYLLAKAYEQLGLDAEAEATARRALALRLPSAAVRREAELVVGRAAWRAGHAAASAAAFAHVVATSTQAARRLEAEDWAERARRGPPRAAPPLGPRRRAAVE